MAAGKRRTASSSVKKTTATRRRKRQNKKRARSQELSFHGEIILWVLFAVSILLFISNFGIGGKVGNLASGVLFGLFGVMAYAFPILLFIGSCFVISNKNNHFAVFKFIATILLFCALCMFFQLLVHDDGMLAKEFIKNSYKYSMTNKKGGGVFGSLFVWLCVPNFGKFGSFVIDAILIIICLVLITERSAWLGVKRSSERFYKSAKEDANRYRDRKQKRLEAREEREALMEKNRQNEATERKSEEKEIRKPKRSDKKAEGVAIDTSIKKKKRSGSDELGEIKLPLESFTEDRTNVRKRATRPATPEKDVIQVIPQKAFSDMPRMREPKVLRRDPVTITLEPMKKEPKTEYDDEAMLENLLSDVGSMIDAPDMPKTEDIENAWNTEEKGNTESAWNINEKDVENAWNLDEANEFENAENAWDRNEAPDFEEAEKTDDVRNLPNESAVENAWKETEKPVKAEKTTAEENAAIAEQMQEAMEEKQTKQYVFPPISLLKAGDKKTMGDSKAHLMETANKLQQTLKNFGVNVTITNVSSGPAVTRYEIQPEMGVKVSKIVNLSDDIKLNLAAADIRIEAPIPGKAAIGIEVPNKENVTVMLRDLIDTEEFKRNPSKLAFAAGKDIGGQVIVTDIAKMPHLLIAGATGSGKSVCINTIIMSILYKAHPDDVKLIMIDPKVVELSVYNGIPHLMIPVVTDPKKAAGALNWAVAEMSDRYQKFADYGVRDIKGYNAKVESIAQIEDDDKPKKLPQIVIIVDELADLMMVASNEVETAICRLAQLARAAGIHLIIATQRPSVNVITGLIKANMPSRVAFAVTSGVDSRTILDMNGAEKLLGKGDMLFFPQSYQKPLRVQGAFVTDNEVSDVVEFLKNENGAVEYNTKVQEKMEQSENISMTISGGNTADDRDVLFAEVGKFLIDSEKGSIGSIQRKFKVGFNRAARIMDQLEEAGLVGPEEGTKPRKVLMSKEEFEQYIEEVV